MNILVKEINYIIMTGKELQAIGCTDIEDIISEDFGTLSTVKPRRLFWLSG